MKATALEVCIRSLDRARDYCGYNEFDALKSPLLRPLATRRRPEEFHRRQQRMLSEEIDPVPLMAHVLNRVIGGSLMAPKLGPADP